MSEHGDDLRREVIQLRQDVDRLMRRADDTRRLAAGTDEDVSEMRAAFHAQTRVLNALRETQLEQGRAIESLRAGQAEHTRILAEHGAMLTEILRRLPRQTDDRA